MNFRMNLSVELILVILVVTFVNVPCVFGYRRKTGPPEDEPLVLSSFLPHNDGEARNRSKVILPELPGLDSYAGYMRVARYNITTFFWYFPAKENPEGAPVVLFLEGTPGKDAFFSLFTQNGPFSVAPNGSLVPRAESWNNKHNMIYINGVLGLGYTFSKWKANIDPLRPEFIADTVLPETLRQFFEMFPWLKKNDFFLSGNYFGSALVLRLWSTFVIRGGWDTIPRVKGIILAHGFLAPLKQLKFGEYLSRIGLIDFPGGEDFLQREQRIKHLYEEKSGYIWDSFEELIIGKLSLFNNLTGYANPFNTFKDGIVPSYSDRYLKWLADLNVRRALHAGKRRYYDENSQGVKAFRRDSIVSFPSAEFSKLLESNFSVLYYSGNLDLLSYPLMDDQFWIDHLPPSKAQKYKAAKKEIWRYPEHKLAGYKKRVDNLIKALVINAGHLSSIDQPQRTLQLVETFISGNL